MPLLQQYHVLCKLWYLLAMKPFFLLDILWILCQPNWVALPLLMCFWYLFQLRFVGSWCYCNRRNDARVLHSIEERTQCSNSTTEGTENDYGKRGLFPSIFLGRICISWGLSINFCLTINSCYEMSTVYANCRWE